MSAVRQCFQASFVHQNVISVLRLLVSCQPKLIEEVEPSSMKVIRIASESVSHATELHHRLYNVHLWSDCLIYLLSLSTKLVSYNICL